MVLNKAALAVAASLATLLFVSLHFRNDHRSSGHGGKVKAAFVALLGPRYIRGGDMTLLGNHYMFTMVDT